MIRAKGAGITGGPAGARARRAIQHPEACFGYTPPRVSTTGDPRVPLLHHHRHRLRQRPAPPRPRLREGPRGRDRALAPPAGRRHVLPDRHRRARPEGRATTAAEAGKDPQAFVDEISQTFVRRVEGAGRQVRPVLPHHGPPSRAGRAGALPPAERRRSAPRPAAPRSTRTRTRACTARAARASRPRRTSTRRACAPSTR